MKIKEMNINIVLEERWENIKKPEDGHKFLNKILVAAKEELTGKVAAAITIKVCVKGLPDNHQFALDEFKKASTIQTNRYLKVTLQYLQVSSMTEALSFTRI